LRKDVTPKISVMVYVMLKSCLKIVITNADAVVVYFTLSCCSQSNGVKFRSSLKLWQHCRSLIHNQHR